MKKLLLCTLMSVVLSSAFAAPAPKTSPAVATAKGVKAAQDYIGVWVSTERTTVVAPGTMTLTSDGHVTLAPEGFDPLKGTYTVKGQFIDITMDRGRATLIYSINQNKMTVEYENGSIQSFTKQPAPTTAKPKAKK